MGGGLIGGVLGGFCLQVHTSALASVYVASAVV